MMTYLAHSAEKDEDSTIIVPAQPYTDHIIGSYNNCQNILENVMKHIKYANILKCCVLSSILYHDIGKLSEYNQEILSGLRNEKKLRNHIDAGVYFFINKYKTSGNILYAICAYYILSHHGGLSNMNDEPNQFFKIIRTGQFTSELTISDDIRDKDDDIKNETESNIDNYIRIHNILLPTKIRNEYNKIDKIIQTLWRKNPDKCKSFSKNFLLMKIGVSILVDGDQNDTIRNYRNGIVITKQRFIDFNENIIDLKNTINNYNKPIYNKRQIRRNKQRTDFFNICDSVPLNKKHYYVNGTVGIGKTLSIMNLGLRVANKFKLKNIIFMLPYTALIDQSAEEYKKIFTKNYDIGVIHSVYRTSGIFEKIYNNGFNAPISLTTSVNFFDILTTNFSSRFKNIHKIVGSVIIIDEYHAIANHQFWPIILKFLKYLADYCNCKIIYSSGTPIKYWNNTFNISEIIDGEKEIKNVINNRFNNKMLSGELKRVRFTQTIKQEWLFDDIISDINKNVTGSCFVVFNTKRKAVAFVKQLEKTKHNFTKIYLRFSGLIVNDRIKQLDEIKQKLSSGENIVLVATQGSDIGLNISFKCGYKELSDYASILQMSGRINRSCEYIYNQTFLHIFKLNDKPDNNNTYKDNPEFIDKIKVTDDFIGDTINPIMSPVNSTNIFDKELEYLGDDQQELMKSLYDNFNNNNFETIYDDFSLINTPNINILIDKDIYNNFQQNKPISYIDIQENSVNLTISDKLFQKLLENNKIIELSDNQEIPEDEKNNKRLYNNRIFYWNGEYDSEKYGIYADIIFEK